MACTGVLRHFTFSDYSALSFAKRKEGKDNAMTALATRLRLLALF